MSVTCEGFFSLHVSCVCVCDSEEMVRIQGEAAIIDARREEYARVVSELARVQVHTHTHPAPSGGICVLKH